MIICSLLLRAISFSMFSRQTQTLPSLWILYTIWKCSMKGPPVFQTDSPIFSQSLKYKILSSLRKSSQFFKILWRSEPMFLKYIRQSFKTDVSQELPNVYAFIGGYIRLNITNWRDSTGSKWGWSRPCPLRLWFWRSISVANRLFSGSFGGMSADDSNSCWNETLPCDEFY